MPRKPSQAKRQSSVGSRGEALGGVEAGELLVPFVDRLDVERLLQAGVVAVVLLVQLSDEAVGVVAQCVELTGGEGVCGHGP